MPIQWDSTQQYKIMNYCPEQANLQKQNKRLIAMAGVQKERGTG